MTNARVGSREPMVEEVAAERFAESVSDAQTKVRDDSLQVQRFPADQAVSEQRLVLAVPAVPV